MFFWIFTKPPLIFFTENLNTLLRGASHLSNWSQGPRKEKWSFRRQEVGKGSELMMSSAAAHPQSHCPSFSPCPGISPRVLCPVTVTSVIFSKNKFIMQFPCLLTGWNPIDPIACKMKFKFPDKQAFICCSSPYRPLNAASLNCTIVQGCQAGTHMRRDLRTCSFRAAPSPLENCKIAFLLTEASRCYPGRGSFLPCVQPQHHLALPSDWNGPHFPYFCAYISLFTRLQGFKGRCRFSLIFVIPTSRFQHMQEFNKWVK